MSRLILLIFSGVLLASCISNRKIVLLQYEDELKNDDIPQDTIRSYFNDRYDYQIQSEDVLSVRFESLTDQEFDVLSKTNYNAGSLSPNNLLISGNLVDKEGFIDFPEIGAVKVAGLTIHEIQKKLSELAANYLEDPVVKVRLLNFRVTLLGEVNKEGTIVSYNNRITIMEAIGLAGGLTDLADRSKVKVIRQQGGMSRIIYVNILEEELLNSEHLFVHQGDVIIFPPLKQRPFRRYFAPNLSLVISSASLMLLVLNLFRN